jgi:hypothetical protein
MDFGVPVLADRWCALLFFVLKKIQKKTCDFNAKSSAGGTI